MSTLYYYPYPIGNGRLGVMEVKRFLLFFKRHRPIPNIYTEQDRLTDEIAKAKQYLSNLEKDLKKAKQFSNSWIKFAEQSHESYSKQMNKKTFNKATHLPPLAYSPQSGDDKGNHKTGPPSSKIVCTAADTPMQSGNKGKQNNQQNNQGGQKNN